MSSRPFLEYFDEICAIGSEQGSRSHVQNVFSRMPVHSTQHCAIIFVYASVFLPQQLLLTFQHGCTLQELTTNKLSKIHLHETLCCGSRENLIG